MLWNYWNIHTFSVGNVNQYNSLGKNYYLVKFEVHATVLPSHPYPSIKPEKLMPTCKRRYTKNGYRMTVTDSDILETT